ncbi:MAG: alpha/beta hydrolase [Bacteroides sp.]|nr:alpha/beta hydrolase [Bacteroides sp.]
MKLKTLSALLCFAVLSLQAQEKLELPLGDAPAEGFKIDMTDLTTSPGVTVYRPKRPNGTAIIMCPGGGYSHQAASHEGHDMAQWMNAQGVTYVVLKYRLPKGDPSRPLDDALEAVKLVRTHAKDWKLNPRKIGIMGASAGGHLASMAATHWTDSLSRPDFQVLFYPVITMDSTLTHKGSRQNLLGENPSDDLVNSYSNELCVKPTTPQAFIMLSGDDRGVPPANSVKYYMSLLDNKVPATLHIYPSGGHGWGFRDSFPYKRQWTGELEHWLRSRVF